MLVLFAVELLEFVQPVVQAVDWDRVGRPAAVASTVMLCAIPLARWYANIQSRRSDAELEIERKHTTFLKTQVADLNVKLATKTAEYEARTEELTNRNEQIVTLNNENKRILTAGQKLYREVVDLRQLKPLVDRLQTQNQTANHENKSLADEIVAKANLIESQQAALTDWQKKQIATDKRMRRVQRLGGYLIHAKSYQKVPRFKPLSERRVPIISVLNIKGGVGKTTVTAHLAGAFARKGYRVLLLDLDLQGSLSSLMLAQPKITELGKAGLLTQDFFNQTAKNVSTKMSPYIIPVEGLTHQSSGSISIMATTDALAYSELNLTLGWLLKQGQRDSRFLLRKGLHYKSNIKKYDIVLLDCPPLMNMSCINALAASDFLLSPTVLTAKSTERAAILLGRLNKEDFKLNINSHLRALGVIANRTNRNPPIGNDAFIWQDFAKIVSAEIYGKVKQFDSVIAQDAKIAAGEAEYNHLKPGSRAEIMFNALAHEVEMELPSDCRRSASTYS